MTTGGRTRLERPDLRAVIFVAIASACGFGTFYGLYTSAPVALAGGGVSAGTRTAVFMACVIAVQPLVTVLGRWMRVRSRSVGGGLASMALGFAVLPLAGGWPGLVLTGLGFGVFVVTSAAWVRELADASTAGRALGIYGLASAVGATVAAPAALALADGVGVVGVAAGGALVTALGLVPVALARRIGEHGRPGLTDAPTDHVPTLPRSGTGPAPETEASLAVGDATTYLSDDEPPARSRVAEDDRDGSVHSDDPGSSPRSVHADDDAHPRRRGPFGVVAPTLVIHSLAVIAYGLMLTSAGTLAEAGGGTAAVVAAFSVQGAVAVGRPVAGWLADRWSGAGTLLVAAVAVAGALAWAVADDDPVRFVVAATLVGAFSGAVQTAALTVMMRRAVTPGQAERVSMGWNVTFDVALGLAAAAATRLALV
ncbi:MFS transporter [Georgenia sp. Z1344]|uniref:MFS transporter n=1 Tax=Georgenia sp. Z1344 TaxID=3416706 RepID=UPI003CEB4882